MRFEVGIVTDLTNEQYFEETYSDTLFLTRTLRESPEHRTAGVVAMEWAIRGGPDAWGLSLRPEVVIGDKTRRATATGKWFSTAQGLGSWSFEPRIEWREDDSFGLERRDWRAAFDARHRRRLGEWDRLDLRVGGEWSDASGDAIASVLDRRVARTSARWARTPLLGWEWDVQASADARTFPDSTSRDHLESTLAVETRRLFGEAHQFTLALGTSHRGTLRDEHSTRDRYWAPRAQIALDLRSDASARLHWSAEGEAMRYAAPDAEVYFDYEFLRTRLDLERDLGVGWAMRIGPRLEWLLSIENASERYAQTGVGLEIEQLSPAAWWSVSPDAGWRQYERETDTIIVAPGLHSSFAYFGLQAMVEWTIAGAWRSRLLADGRVEKHRDPSQDARSLYFSVDVRRLLVPS